MTDRNERSRRAAYGLLAAAVMCVVVAAFAVRSGDLLVAWLALAVTIVCTSAGYIGWEVFDGE